MYTIIWIKWCVPRMLRCLFDVKSFLNSLITLGSLAKWLDSICVYKWFIKMKSSLITFFSIFDRLIWVLCVFGGNLVSLVGWFFIYLCSLIADLLKLLSIFHKILQILYMVCNHRFLDNYIKSETILLRYCSGFMVDHIFSVDFIVESIHIIRCLLNYENWCFIQRKNVHN